MPFYQASSQAVTDLTRVVSEQLDSLPETAIVVIDGRSGAGKSTLAEGLAERLDATLVEGDDFYAGGTLAQWQAMTPAQRAEHCFDWRRLRSVLQSLRTGMPAVYQPFDWAAFDGSLVDEPVVLVPQDIVVVDGVYSGRPELADLVDFAIMVEVPEQRRLSQLAEREGSFDGPWNDMWSSGEDHYFDAVVTPDRFDLVIDPNEDEGTG